jgi:hypothetical protein
MSAVSILPTIRQEKNVPEETFFRHDLAEAPIALYSTAFRPLLLEEFRYSEVLVGALRGRRSFTLAPTLLEREAM